MFFIVTNILIAVCFVISLRINSNNFNFGLLYFAYWWIFNAIGFLIYHNDYSFRFIPFMWIGASVLCVMVGHRIGNHYLGHNHIRLKLRDRGLNRAYNVNLRIKKLIISILVISLVADAIYLIRSEQIGMVFSLRGIMAILNSSEAAKASGSGNDGGSLITKLIGVAYYFSCILYGYAYRIFEIRKSLVIKVLFIINVIIDVVVSAGKFNIIVFIVLFASGLITSMMRDKKLKIKEIRYGRLVLYISIVGAVLYFLMNNRAGHSVGLSGLLAYGFGEIPSFNYWYMDGIHEKTYGVQSFYGIVSHLLKGIKFAEGETNYPLAACAPGVNIFTMFRAVISDFGKIGGLIVLFFVGITSGIANRKLSRSGFANGWMAMLVGALFLGFLMPLGYYLTLHLGYITFIVFMSVTNYHNGKYI